MAVAQLPRLSPRKGRVFTAAAAVLVPVGQYGLIIRPWPLSVPAEMSLAAMMLTGMGLATMVMILTPGWRREGRGVLDEREAAETAAVLSLSYRIMGLLLLAFALWFNLARQENSFGLTAPRPLVTGLLTIDLFWLHILLPSLILVWRSRDDEED
jgi:hypothetical protein